MSTSIQEKFHRQHRRWRDDHAAWRADAEVWRQELRTALGALAEVEDMLRDIIEGLAVHADAVWEGGERIRAHELTLRQEAQTGERRKTDKQWAALHHREAARHERLADAHARIGRQHRLVVAEIMKLLNRARAAM